MKTIHIFLMAVLVLTGPLAAKKSKMDPVLLEKAARYLNEMTFVVVIKDGVPSSPGTYPNRVEIENAGERTLYWEPYADLGSNEIKKGEILVLEEVKTKKKSYIRITLRTLDKRKYVTTRTYTVKIKDSETETVKEIEKQKEVEVESFFRTIIEFRFNKKRHANTPENFKFIKDAIGQSFKFFVSKGDALVYIDSEMDSAKSIVVGMSVNDVVRILGLPKKKIKDSEKFIYIYNKSIVTFVDGKAVEIELRGQVFR